MEKLRLFQDWFFRDKMVIPYPQIDEGSKRLGRLICMSGGVAWSLFVVMVALHGSVSVLVFLFIFSLGPVGTWVSYRVFRACFWVIIWVIDGFRNLKG